MSEVGGHDGPLAEFHAMRAEIELRIKAQHQFLALQLTLTGAIFAFALSQSGRGGLLLAVPFSSYMLCGRLVAQHFGTIHAAKYIRTELSGKVPGGLGWEQWISGQDRGMSTLGSTVPYLLMFPGTSGVALAWTGRFVFDSPQQMLGTRLGLMVIWFAGGAAAAVSAFLLLRMDAHARRRGRPPRRSA